MYEPTCENKNAQGQCVGTYKFSPRFYNSYTQLERWVGSGENLIGVAFPDCADNERFDWIGTLVIDSIEKPLPWDPNTIVNVQPFYAFNPTKFTVQSGSSTSACVAYKDAWQGYDAWIDVTWDSDIQRLVVPYANFWHNQQDWPKGWQTKVFITNQTGSTVDYTIENHLWGGVHGNAQDACASDNENEIEVTVRVLNGETKETDAFRFHVSDTVRSSHDTALFIRMNPVLGGTQPSVHVFANTGGTPLCP